MADPIDTAQDNQLNENERAIALQRHRMQPETHEDFDGKSCVECGDKIPKPRLEMGKVRCVICQTTIENHKKYFGSNK